MSDVETPPLEPAQKDDAGRRATLANVDWGSAVFPGDDGSTAAPVPTDTPEPAVEKSADAAASADSTPQASSPSDERETSKEVRLSRRALRQLQSELNDSGLRLVGGESFDPNAAATPIPDSPAAFGVETPDLPNDIDDRADIDLWATSLSPEAPSHPPRRAALPLPIPDPAESTDELPTVNTGEIELLGDGDESEIETELDAPTLIVREPQPSLVPEASPAVERAAAEREDSAEISRMARAARAAVVAPLEPGASFADDTPSPFKEESPNPFAEDSPALPYPRVLSDSSPTIPPIARASTPPPYDPGLLKKSSTGKMQSLAPSAPADPAFLKTSTGPQPASPDPLSPSFLRTSSGRMIALPAPPDPSTPVILKPPSAVLPPRNLTPVPPPPAGDETPKPAFERALRGPDPAINRSSDLTPAGSASALGSGRRVPMHGPKSETVIGIDLGTTYSCGAFVVNGRAQVLASRRGPPSIPSVVSFLAGGKAVVGEAALRLQATNPANTILGSKRLMGRPFSSPIVQELRTHFAYEIVPGENGEAAVRIDDRVISLEEVAALILREIREAATLQLDERVNRAVITCPAHFNERQRDAVRTAGELAGFYVERILSEPTAAALTYGVGQEIADRKILVYDLGGGTFDVSILDVRGDVFEVLATGGDTFLGGLDFDACIAELLVERFLEVEHIDARTDPVAMARIFQFAEQAKRELSDLPTAIVEIDHLVVQPYAARTLTLPIRRSRVEEMWEPLVDHTLAIVADVCRRASLDPKQIDDVIVVGGQSRSPLIGRKVADFFGKAANRSLHPEEAIALGAAKYGASMTSDQGVTLIDALPMSIGVGLPGGRFKKLIPRDSKLPASHTYHLRTTRDDQETLELLLFQGEEARVELDEPLGILTVPDLPPGPKGTVSVDVTLHVTPECILEISAQERKSGRKMSWRLGTRDTPEALRSKLGLPPQPTHEELERRKMLTNRPKGVWAWLTDLFRGSGNKKKKV
jgi:molecular chaperone DnaK